MSHTIVARMGLCKFADMQGCGHAVKRQTGRGHVALCFLTVQHLAVALLFSHPMPVGTGYWFHDFFHTLCHYAYRSLRIVEAQGLWIMEDHRIVLECWRSDFVSSISSYFFRVY